MVTEYSLLTVAKDQLHFAIKLHWQSMEHDLVPAKNNTEDSVSPGHVIKLLVRNADAGADPWHAGQALVGSCQL